MTSVALWIGLSMTPLEQHSLLLLSLVVPLLGVFGVALIRRLPLDPRFWAKASCLAKEAGIRAETGAWAREQLLTHPEMHATLAPIILASDGHDAAVIEAAANWACSGSASAVTAPMLVSVSDDRSAASS